MFSLLLQDLISDFIFQRTDTDYCLCMCLKNTWLGQCPLGCHAVLGCFTTIPAGGLGVAPFCSATLKSISFIHFWLFLIIKPYVHVGLPSVLNLPKTFKFPQLSFWPAKPSEKKFSVFMVCQKNVVILQWGKRPRVLACMHVAYRDGKLNISDLDKAFIFNGFSNWKDGL